jgi:uncharacterized membrane protein YjgN (DUF898 family)
MSFENVPSTTVSEEPHARGDFKGTGGELFLIWIVNAVLTALTLGLYFAVAKVRLYRYFYSNTEFAGSRFRFTGNAMEIFIGTLKAIGVLLALIVGFGILSALLIPLKSSVLTAVSMVGFYAVFIFLSQFAIYATMAYRASRASYREINFRLEGNPWVFAREAIPYLLVGFVTFGLALPRYTHWKIGRIYNNLRYGTLRFAWDAPLAEYWKLALKGFFLSVLTFGVYYFFWLPKWFAFVRGHLSVGGCRFHGEIKAGELFMITLTNLLLIVFTLGLAAPWAMVRALRFFMTRLTLENPSRLEAALQDRRQKVGANGEAIADAMDMGVGLGF